jgi:adenine-specific DNA-methyltransferase
MPAKPSKGKTVATLRHDAKRKNLPTVEYQSLMREADESPIQVAYERRNRDLDPQFVWRGDPKLAPVLQDDSRYMPSR